MKSETWNLKSWNLNTYNCCLSNKTSFFWLISFPQKSATEPEKPMHDQWKKRGSDTKIFQAFCRESIEENLPFVLCSGKKWLINIRALWGQRIQTWKLYTKVWMRWPLQERPVCLRTRSLAWAENVRSRVPNTCASEWSSVWPSLAYSPCSFKAMSCSTVKLVKPASRSALT